MTGRWASPAATSAAVASRRRPQSSGRSSVSAQLTKALRTFRVCSRPQGQLLRILFTTWPANAREPFPPPSEPPLPFRCESPGRLDTYAPVGSDRGAPAQAEGRILDPVVGGDP